MSNGHSNAEQEQYITLTFNCNRRITSKSTHRPGEKLDKKQLIVYSVDGKWSK